MKIRKILSIIVVACALAVFSSTALATSNSQYWSVAFDQQRSSSYETPQTMVLPRVIYEYLNYADMSQSFVDGQFGSNTRSKVILFQQMHNLSDDGIVGPQTWGKLHIKTAKGNDISSNIDGCYARLIRLYQNGTHAPEAAIGSTSGTYFGFNPSSLVWHVRLYTNPTLYQVN